MIDSNDTDPLVLAIDTLGDVCSVALLYRGTIFTVSKHAKRHATQVHCLVDALFAEHRLALANITAIVVNIGPGSLTGVKIGIATSLGYALPGDTPVLSLNHLEILAVQSYLSLPCKTQAKQSGIRYAVCEDARLDACYYAMYRVSDTQVECLHPACVLARTDIPSAAWSCSVQRIGSAWPQLSVPSAHRPSSFAETTEPLTITKAHAMLSCYTTMRDNQTLLMQPALHVTPMYLRGAVR